MKSRVARLALYFGLVALVIGSITVTGCTPDKAPVISSLEAGKTTVNALGSTQLRVLAYDPDGDEMSYEWLASGGTIIADGAQATWTAPQVPAATTDTITVRVKDNQGIEVEKQMDLSVTPNTPPVIEALTASRTLANRDDRVVIECVAGDVEQDSLNYTWTATGGRLSPYGPVAVWQAPNTLGSFTITVSVDDGKGGEASDDVAIAVAANRAPVINSLASVDSVVVYGSSTVVTCHALDPDADDLTYIWAAAEGTITGEGPSIEWAPPSICGHTVPITVTVLDGRGGEASAEIKIETRMPGCGGAPAPNQPPVIKSLTSKDSVVVYGNTTTVTCQAEDPDADNLTYVWSAAEGTITGEGPSVEWAPPSICGHTVPITVTVLDGSGDEVSKTIEIKTRMPGCSGG